MKNGITKGHAAFDYVVAICLTLGTWSWFGGNWLGPNSHQKPSQTPAWFLRREIGINSRNSPPMNEKTWTTADVWTVEKCAERHAETQFQCFTQLQTSVWIMNDFRLWFVRIIERFVLYTTSVSEVWLTIPVVFCKKIWWLRHVSNFQKIEKRYKSYSNRTIYFFIRNSKTDLCSTFSFQISMPRCFYDAPKLTFTLKFYLLGSCLSP